jgi:hypothetical protein
MFSASVDDRLARRDLYSHPEGVYDDPREVFTSADLPMLRYHFQFENERDFVGTMTTVGAVCLHLLSCPWRESYFANINNLFTPKTPTPVLSTTGTGWCRESG